MYSDFNVVLVLTLLSDSTLQIDAVPKADASIQRRVELHKEVEALKVSCEKQVGMCE